MTTELRAGLVVTADASDLIGSMKQGKDALGLLRQEAAKSVTDFSRLSTASDRFVSIFAKGRGALRGFGTDTKSARDSASVFATALDQEEDAFRRLVLAIDPAARAAAEFKAGQEQVNRAVRAGIATNEEAARALQQLEARQEAAMRSLNNGGAAASRFGTGIQQASYQFTDAVVQFQGGVAPAIIFAQQAPQLLGAFGAMGAALGLVAALAPPVISFFIGAADGAKSLDEAMGQLDATTDRVKDRLETLRDPNLSATFGNMTGSIREMTSAMLALDRAAELKKLRETLDGLLRENIDPGFWQKAGQAFTSGLVAGAGGAQSAGYLQAQNLSARNYGRLTGGQGISYEDFTARRTEITDLAKAGEVEKVTREISRLMQDMSGGGPITDMKDELVQMLIALGDVASKTAEVEAQFNGTAQAAKTWTALSEAGIGIWDRMAERGREVTAAGNERIRVAQNELGLQQVISVFGEQSKQAEAERARIARENYELELQREGIFGDQREQLMKIYDQTVAAQDATDAWAKNMAAVGAEVSGILSGLANLAGGMLDRAAKQAELTALNAGATIAEATARGQDVRRQGQFNQRATQFGGGMFGNAVAGVERWWGQVGDRQEASLDAARDAARKRDRKSTGGGGAGAGLNAAASITAELAKIKPSYEADVAAADAWRDKALAGLKKTREGYAQFADEVETIYQERLAKAYRDDLDRREDWRSGAERALLDLNDDMMTWADLSENVVTQFAKSGEEAFVSFATKGKASMGDFVDFVAEQFARLAYQTAILPGINALFSSIFPSLNIPGLGGTSLPTNHTGSPGVMRTYAIGRGYGDTMRSDERLTMMRKGEEIMTSRALENAGALISAMTALAARPASVQGSAGGLNFTFVNKGTPQQVEETRETTDSRGQRQYQLVTSDIVATGLTAPGGKAGKAMSSQFGVRKPGIRRT